MTIFELLDLIREQANDERDKGNRFERLTKAYLKADPAWAQVFEDVYLWSEWPDREGNQDLGVDLVGIERDTGIVWAIQCKCFDEDTYVDVKELAGFFSQLGKISFGAGLVVTTSNNWSSNAEKAFEGQSKPIQRISLSDLDQSPIDWSTYSPEDPDALVRTAPKTLRPHQVAALEDVISGFKEHDRGKLIMACGTGKTFTSLRIAETMLPDGGTVLFLVPSIALLSQTLREWTGDAEQDLKCFAVCSDTKVGKNKDDNGDITSFDLAYPATTNTEKLVKNFDLHRKAFAGLTVVFSTYQSIDVVAEAQKAGLPDFDLIICDEAHRTTGATLADGDESAFVRVHDDEVLKGAKRLYMTATPRVYGDAVKVKARELDATLASMDDESLYGPEFHRLMFGQAVELGLLTDYRVVVLAVGEDHVAKIMAGDFGSKLDLPINDIARLMGCYNGLTKKSGDKADFASDPAAVKRAVAFAQSIKASKAFEAALPEVVNSIMLTESDSDEPRVAIHHVDGTQNVLKRNEELKWLKSPVGSNEVKVLTNARCLSEGVDVPSLDAVIFLSPRNSTVDVVQSVGRVMRKAEGKNYGYVIIPVAVADSADPKTALDDNKRFKTVWQVLQALRSHDERFNAMVNKADLNKEMPDNVITIFPHSGAAGDEDQSPPADLKEKLPDSSDAARQQAFTFQNADEWQDAILAKLVTKVGQRAYWEDWAKDVADIVWRFQARITALVENGTEAQRAQFAEFVKGLRTVINPSVTEAAAVEMLAQHMVTGPVFDALFEGYSFSKANPVSQVMDKMLATLEGEHLEAETESLNKFYASVRQRVTGIENAAGRQQVIKELYDRFFQGAFSVTADKLGIVYTPVEVVDYMIHAVERVLNRSLGASLGDQGVHILDPFTGTGTFITRLIGSGLISAANREHKFRYELHANEIVLLAYYIACVNIEETFHGDSTDSSTYLPFDGLVLTDTFQMTESGVRNQLGGGVFAGNSERAEQQLDQPIQVIISNPPYSVGQEREGDGDANERYPDLDKRVDDTYRKRSDAKLTKSLNDSYIRAFRWASDRIGDQGIVCFVSGGGWLIGNAMDGMRRCLVDEFAEVYVLDLRGNQRTTQGEKSLREGGKIFGSGSRTAVTITLLVKKQGHTGPGTVHYHDIGDYLSREDKLAKLVDFTEHEPEWQTIVPNEFADWINQRRSDYGQLAPLSDENAKGKESSAVFTTYSLGLSTNRDTWAYSFSPLTLQESMTKLIDTYEAVRKATHGGGDPSKVPQTARDIKWDGNLKGRLSKNEPVSYDIGSIRTAMYRPYVQEFVYFDRHLNNSVYLMPRYFQQSQPSPRVIILSGIGSTTGVSVLMTDRMPNLHTVGQNQVFPEFWFEDAPTGGMFENLSNGAQRREGVSTWAVEQFSATAGRAVDREAIFFYVYGVLHSEQFLDTYEDNLVKERPRIPLPKNAKQFEAFSEAGRKLADLHLNYETVEPYDLEEVWSRTDLKPQDLYKVTKMRFPKGQRVKDRPSSIIYNDYITLNGIPDEVWDYMLSGKAALYWIVDRYQVTKDKDSGIVNDPNEFSDDPRYIVDLVKRIVTVSLKTLEIVENLPNLKF